jgi:hypothetical protein
VAQKIYDKVLIKELDFDTLLRTLNQIGRMNYEQTGFEKNWNEKQICNFYYAYF